MKKKKNDVAIVTVAMDSKRPVFQGELCFVRVASVPTDVVTREAVRDGGRLIVGHSETGHHHVVEAADAKLLETPDPLVAYLVAEGAWLDVVHQRSFDTHATPRFEFGPGGGVLKVIRQREMSPQGWVRAAD